MGKFNKKKFFRCHALGFKKRRGLSQDLQNKHLLKHTSFINVKSKLTYQFPNKVNFGIESVEIPLVIKIKKLLSEFSKEFMYYVNQTEAIRFCAFLASFYEHSTVKGKILNLIEYCLSLKDTIAEDYANALYDKFAQSSLSFTSGAVDTVKFFSSELYKQCTKIMSYLSYIFLFDNATASRLRSLGLMDIELSRKLDKGKISVIDFIQDIVKLTDAAYRKMRGDLLESDKDVHIFIEDVENLYRNKENTTHIKPPPDGMISHEVWSAELQRIITTRKNSLNYKYNPALKLYMQQAENRLIACKDKYQSMCVRVRFPSYIVGLFGEPGNGKSKTLSPLIGRSLIRAAGMEYYDGAVAIQSDDKYLSTYNNNVQVCIFDDLGSIDASKNINTFFYPNLVQILASSPFCVPSAAIEDKGKRYYNPIGQLMNTNKIDFGTSAFGVDPRAFNRRLNIYVVVDADEFDPDNVDCYKLKLLRWNKSTKGWEILKNQQGKAMESVSMAEALDFIEWDAPKYWASQRDFEGRIASFSESRCTTCDMFKCVCRLQGTSSSVSLHSFHNAWYYARLSFFSKLAFISGYFPRFIKEKIYDKRVKAERDYNYILNFIKGRNSRYIPSVLALASLLVLLYRTFTTDKSIPKGPDNIWTPPSQTVTSTSRISEGHLDPIVKGNLRKIECSVNGQIHRTHISGLYKRLFVGPAHTLCNIDPNTVVKVFELSSNGTDLQCIGRAQSPMIIRHKDPLIDLAFIYLPSQRPIASVLKYLPFEHGAKASGHSYYLDKGIQSFEYRGSLSVEPVDGNKCKGYIGTGTHPSFDGQCGTPIISRGEDSCILGYNTAGEPGTSTIFFTPLLRRDVPEVDDLCVNNSLKFTNARMSEPSSYPPVTEYLDPDIRLDNSLHVQCTYRPPPSRNKGSKIRRTVIAEDVFRTWPEFRHDYITPIFTKIRHPVYMCPKKHALESMCSQAELIEPDHLEKVIAHLISHFDSPMFNNDEHIDVQTAINGRDGHPYFRSLDKNTSGGFGYEGPKKQHLKFDGYVYSPSDRVNEDIKLYTDKYLSEERADIVYGVALKDEPRPKDKVAMRSIRVFNTAPLPFLIMFKQYFAAWIGCFLDLNNKAETVSGRNNFSRDWTDIHNHVSKFPNIFMGDFSKYDKRISSIIIQAVFRIIIGIKKRHMKISKAEMLIIRGLITDTCFPNYAFDGTCIGVTGSNPSGHYLTFIINNIANSIYIRLAWLHHGFKLSDFERNVSFIACGDDNLGSISDAFKDRFNFCSIKNYFTSIGLKYTTVQKDNSDYTTLPLSSASICKRTFIWDSEFNLYRCPIEFASIGKMLTMTDDNSAVTETERLMQTFISAQIEFAQFGRKLFTLYDTELKSIYAHNGIKLPYASKTYDEIMQTMSSKGISYFDDYDLNCDDHLPNGKMPIST